MQIIHLTKQNFQTARWSGGLTTELYIFPESSTYTNQNFKFRLSTATVEIDESQFTPLPDINRTLMVLEGEMELIHEKQHRKILKPFDVDHFNGSWNTKSLGCCVDFNLMTKGERHGELSGIKLAKNQSNSISINKDLSHVFIYAYAGCFNLTIKNNSYQLNSMEALLIKNPSISIIEAEGVLEGIIVFAEIH